MSVFIELMAYNAILEKWKQDPTQTKHQIGIWSDWTSGGNGIDLPLSDTEVRRMKDFVRRNNQRAFYRLFSEEHRASEFAVDEAAPVIDATLGHYPRFAEASAIARQ